MIGALDLWFRLAGPSSPLSDGNASFSPREERSRLVAFIDAHPAHRDEQLGQAFRKEWAKTEAVKMKMKAFGKKKAQESPEDCAFLAHASSDAVPSFGSVCGWRTPKWQN